MNRPFYSTEEPALLVLIWLIILLAQGNRVRILDVLVPQVHGHYAAPADLSIRGKRNLYEGTFVIRMPSRAPSRCGRRLSPRAAVGVGQSMYQIRHYSDVKRFRNGGAP